MSTAVTSFERIQADPVGFARDVLGVELWSKQREIVEAVRDHDRVSVRSSHATGKTTTAAVAALWWLAGGPGSVVVSTSATDRQVKKILWREIRRRYRQARVDVFRGAAVSDVELLLAEDWYAAGLSTDEPENFAGFHAERVLVIVDEASGVDEAIFEAIEGVLAGGVAKLLLIGNPTRPGGQFFRSHRGEAPLWRTVAVSAFDTPAFTGEPVSDEASKRLVTRRWVDGLRAKWGEGSALWSVRVLGEFPDVGDDGIIPVSAIVAAQARRLAVSVAPLRVSVDVARYGDDETVIVTQLGPRVRVAKTAKGQDLMRTVGEVTLIARRLRTEMRVAPVIVVDDAGVGGGVVDRLRQLGEFRVSAFNGASSSTDPDYANLRAQAFFALRDALPNLDLDGDELLRDDLSSPRYRFDRNNRLLVESKDEIKRRLGRSPDRGDAVAMLMAAPAPLNLADFRPAALPITGDLDRLLGMGAVGVGLSDDDLMRRAW